MGVVSGIAKYDGNTIPKPSCGIFQIEPEDTVEAVEEALRIGYRHIDTAQMYANEEVGEALCASGLRVR